MGAFEKPKLFISRKSFILTIVFLTFLFGLRLFFEYLSYSEFISKPFYFTHADVISAYTKQKNGKKYQVLKLQSKEGQTFYTTTHQKKNFQNRNLRLQIFPDSSIPFWKYLGTFYIKSRIKSSEALPDQTKTAFVDFIAYQHKDRNLASFYNAIFFATPLTPHLRERISALGVSHLVALSGFHLTILWGLLYGVLLMLYRPLQQRYFPYRYALIDVGAAVMLMLGIYVWFVGAPPSLLRSYMMLFVGWGVILLGMELLSFEFLTFVFMFLLVLFPALSVSLSFWLSVAGVFYIFLLLHHTKEMHKGWITFAVIPIGIFLLMLPIVHTLFPVTTDYQMLSPLLSLLFVPFYPLSMLLHLIGQGDLLDTGLKWLFDLPAQTRENLLPLWILSIYVGISLAAIWSRKLFFILITMAAGYASYLFLFV